MPGREIIPAYRLHKKTGKAIVTMYDADGNRRSVLLPGAYGSKKSEREYQRIPARLTANDGAMPEPDEKKPDLLVPESSRDLTGRASGGRMPSAALIQRHDSSRSG
ncbi:MAG: hypothetical protein HYX68_28105 [Planctomycetes bacterium]|nr:hypothetical protein [Planctomycetota bacterium]